MTTKVMAICAVVGIGVASASAQATSDEEQLLAQLKKNLPGTVITAVARTPMPDLYEVTMGANVAYVSAREPRYFLFGKILDTKTLRELAPRQVEVKEQRPSASIAIDFKALPVEDAIKTVRGNGSRVVAVFSDPACPYCKRLEREMANLDNVTIFTFMVPFQGTEKPQAIWCADNREAAWRNYMVDGSEPAVAAKAICQTPLERNTALARRLGVRGTPTMFFSDGSRLDGYAVTNELEARLGTPTKVSAANEPRSKERM